jgi:tetratricopeptide (TPR) repeat protein
MAQIIKFPGRASKFGYTRAKRRARPENPDQLQLFSQTVPSNILNISSGLNSFERALILDEQGDPKAAELYLQAINNNECVADAYCNLGIIQSKQGLTSKAFDSFTKSLSYNPRHFEAHYNLGNLYFEANDWRLARVHYQIAVEIDSNFPNVYFNLGLVLSMNNDFEAAIRALEMYQSLVSPNLAQNAAELLENLRRSLSVKKASQPSSGG